MMNSDSSVETQKIDRYPLRIEVESGKVKVINNDYEKLVVSNENCTVTYEFQNNSHNISDRVLEVKWSKTGKEEKISFHFDRIWSKDNWSVNYATRYPYISNIVLSSDSSFVLVSYESGRSNFVRRINIKESESQKESEDKNPNSYFWCGDQDFCSTSKEMILSENNKKAYILQSKNLYQWDIEHGETKKIISFDVHSFTFFQGNIIYVDYDKTIKILKNKSKIPSGRVFDENSDLLIKNIENIYGLTPESKVVKISSDNEGYLSMCIAKEINKKEDDFETDKYEYFVKTSNVMN